MRGRGRERRGRERREEGGGGEGGHGSSSSPRTRLLVGSHTHSASSESQQYSINAGQYGVKKAFSVLTILLPGNAFFNKQKIRTVQESQLDLEHWDLFFNASTKYISKYLFRDTCFCV